jgi:hypothetical protein
VNYIEDSIEKNVENNITIDDIKGISLRIKCNISFCDYDNADVIEWSQRDETSSINLVVCVLRVKYLGRNYNGNDDATQHFETFEACEIKLKRY